MDENIGLNPRILLIQPPYNTLFPKDSGFTIPLGLLYNAASLKQEGIDVRVYNADTVTSWFKRGFYYHESLKNFTQYKKNLENNDYYTWIQIKNLVKNYDPDIVGISNLTITNPSANKTAEIIRQVKKDVIIIAGGIDATIRPLELLKEGRYDYVVRGEGEKTILELIGHKMDATNIEGISYIQDQKVVHNKPRKYIENLDKIPFPAHETLIDSQHYPTNEFGRIITSRGCPYRCEFCACSIISGKKTRYRTIDNVIKEIESLIKKYGTRYFSIQDDTFYLNDDRMVEFSEKILEKKIKWNCLIRADNIDLDVISKMKKTGLDKVDVGIESGSQEILDIMKKDIDLKESVKNIIQMKEMGIHVIANFIIGYPGEDKNTLKKTKNIIKKLDVEYTVELFRPFQGTQIYEKLKKEDKIIEQPITNYYEYYNQTFKDQKIIHNELVTEHKKMMIKCIKKKQST